MDVQSRGGIIINVCNCDMFSVVNVYIDLSVRTMVKLCTLGVFALGVCLVS